MSVQLPDSKERIASCIAEIGRIAGRSNNWTAHSVRERNEVLIELRLALADFELDILRRAGVVIKDPMD